MPFFDEIEKVLVFVDGFLVKLRKDLTDFVVEDWIVRIRVKEEKER